MSEFNGELIFEVLKEKGIDCFYHANSVKTSLSHITLGGQASRLAVIKSNLPQTNQITDQSDKDVGVFNDVFFDFVDIHQRASNRNKYGPVLFRWKSELLNFLPENSVVLITKSNPSKWKAGDLQENRYFISIEDLKSNFSYGNFDQMLMIRLSSGLVKFDKNFLDVCIDDPLKIEDKPSKVHVKSLQEIENLLKSFSIDASVNSRN